MKWIFYMATTAILLGTTGCLAPVHEHSERVYVRERVYPESYYHHHYWEHKGYYHQHY